MTSRKELSDVQRELYLLQVAITELEERLMALATRSRQLYIKNDDELDKKIEDESE